MTAPSSTSNPTTGAPIAPGLFATLRTFPREAWILFAGTFLNKFGTFVIPFLSLYITGKGYTLADAGMAIGAYGAGTLAACFLGGYLADHIGRRKTIALSMFSGAATMLLLSQANSRASFIIFTGLNALAAELYRPASSALLTDLVAPAQRVTAFAAYRLAFNAGWAFGPATAGFLANRSFNWLFIGDAFTSCLFGIVAWFALPHGLRATSVEAGWKPAFENIRRNKRFLQILFSTLLIGPVFFQASSTYGIHLARLGFSSALYGALLSLNGIIVVCLELPLTVYTRRFPPRSCMAVGYLLTGSGFGLNAFAHSVPMLVLGMFLFTLGEIISMPVGSGLIANLAPPNMRGRYMGMHGIAWSVAFTFGPGGGMWLLGYSPALLWAICACCGIMAALAITRRVD